MENTPLQRKIVKTYQDLAEYKVIYPSYAKVAKKVGVSVKYAFYVIKEYQRQKQAFKIK